MRFITVLGTAIAALLLSTPLAVAQETPEIAIDDCYVEWESNVRVNLESLCNRINPAGGTQQPAVGAVGDRAAGTSSAPASPTLTVRVISDVGSTVYSNGVSASGRYIIPQPTVDPTVGAFLPGTLQPSPPSRRYVSYQIFYPNPYFFEWRQFGHRRRRFSPSPDAATPPTSPVYRNPSVPIRGDAPVTRPVLIPRIDEQQ